MKRVMEETTKLQQAVYNLNLHLELKNTKIGTTIIENLSKRICRRLPERRNETLTAIIVGWRINEARNIVREANYKNTKVWRECKSMMEEENVLRQYNIIWGTEKGRQHKFYKDKLSRKIQFYRRKYKRTIVIPDSIEGITISDQEIPDGIMKPPQCYGNSEINNVEREVLMLPPRYAVFDRVKESDCKAEIEKGMAKFRWSYENSEERENVNYIEGNTFDFRNMRATHLPFNKRITLPKAINQEVEVEIQSLKLKLQTVTKEYITNYNENNMLSNLTSVQRRGLKSLEEKKKAKEMVIFQTDKTNTFSTDDIDNYRMAGQEHIKNDAIVTDAEKESLETLMNAHGIMWTRILNAGQNFNHEERIRKNMLNENCEVAPLYTLRKDHKVCVDKTKGPPTRPICGAESCYNGKMSHLLSRILTPVKEESETSCRSTEEMLAAIKTVNENVVGEDVVIGSADVKALYPSLDIDETIEVVTQMFMESKVEIEGVDYKELSLYLALNRSKEELTTAGVVKECPKRRSNRGLKPTITASGIKTEKAQRYGPWIFPNKEPTKTETKVMLKEALKIALEIVLKNHIYTYDGVNRKQTSGGAIGLELTGVIAEIFMTWWDKELIKRTGELGVTFLMYERYVDDIDMAAKGQLKGKRYKNGVIEETEEAKREDEEKEKDEVMMQFIKSVGDEIHSSIKLEVDFPSQHEDRKLPILDVKVWIGRRETDGRRVVLHEYYEKEISSKWVVHEKSALSLSMKRTILTQQVLRIFLNCSKDLPWDEVVEHVNKMMMRVQLSGYNQKFRHEIVHSAIKAYHKIKEEEENGSKPMYRPKGYQKEERKEEKAKKKITWYEKGGYKSVIFIKATPGSMLKKRYEEEIKKTSLRIKVVEQAGTSLKRMLQSSDPFEK